jgi:hypothetical protein
MTDEVKDEVAFVAYFVARFVRMLDVPTAH